MNQQEVERAYALIGQGYAILGRELGTSPDVSEPPPPVVETPKIYGRGGYTDDNDPRAANARGHASNNNLVTGVHVQVHTQPSQPWRAILVSLIDEGAAGGRHVAYVGQRGGSADVALLTGYNGEIADFDDRIYHAPGAEIVIDGGFMPPDLGPLAIALVDNHGALISDVVASLGLPGNHHVSYKIVFERR